MLSIPAVLTYTYWTVASWEISWMLMHCYYCIRKTQVRELLLLIFCIIIIEYNTHAGIFEDGRILVAANQIDCTFQPQAGSRTYAVAQRTLGNVKEKIREMLDLNLVTEFIVPCSAKWGWVARTLPYEDAEEDMEVWMRKILRAFSLTNTIVPDTTKFIEEASQLNQIENW